MSFTREIFLLLIKNIYGNYLISVNVLLASSSLEKLRAFDEGERDQLTRIAKNYDER